MTKLFQAKYFKVLYFGEKFTKYLVVSKIMSTFASAYKN